MQVSTYSYAVYVQRTPYTMCLVYRSTTAKHLKIPTIFGTGIKISYAELTEEEAFVKK